MSLIKKPIIGVSYIVSILSGIIQFGITSYIPLFVQGAMAGTPLHVGAAMAPMAMGWPLGSILSGKLILKVGYKRVLAAGLGFGVLGAAALQALQPNSPLLLMMFIVAVIGLAMGLSATPVIIAVQNAVEWNRRGTATALTQFSRSMGGVIGVALMGLIIAYAGDANPAGLIKPGTVLSDAQYLLEPVKRMGEPTDIINELRLGLAQVLRIGFALPLLSALAALALIIKKFPSGKVDKHKAE